MYRDNTAYDFEMFAPKKKVVEIPVRESKRNRSLSDKKAVSLNKGTLVSVCAVVAVLLLIFAQLHCQLKNSEVVDQIYQAEKTIETLQSENTRLQVELDGKVSFSNMEATAKSMGMQKATVAQTEYVNLCTEDTAEVTVQEEGIMAKLAEWF